MPSWHYYADRARSYNSVTKLMFYNVTALHTMKYLLNSH